MNSIQVSFTVNGQAVNLNIAPNRSLLDVLREDLGLTGAKDSCGGEGECGACTVILDGAAVNACLVLIGQVQSCVVETIEGLVVDGNLHPLQTAFVEAGAVQCGFCTPGKTLATFNLLGQNPDPKDDEIREALNGVLCRCTGYVKIIDAVRLAGKRMRDHG